MSTTAFREALKLLEVKRRGSDGRCFFCRSPRGVEDHDEGCPVDVLEVALTELDVRQSADREALREPPPLERLEKLEDLVVQIGHGVRGDEAARSGPYFMGWLDQRFNDVERHADGRVLSLADHLKRLERLEERMTIMDGALPTGTRSRLEAIEERLVEPMAAGAGSTHEARITRLEELEPHTPEPEVDVDDGPGGVIAGSVQPNDPPPVPRRRARPFLSLGPDDHTHRDTHEETFRKEEVHTELATVLHSYGRDHVFQRPLQRLEGLAHSDGPRPSLLELEQAWGDALLIHALFERANDLEKSNWLYSAAHELLNHFHRDLAELEAR